MGKKKPDAKPVKPHANQPPKGLTLEQELKWFEDQLALEARIHARKVARESLEQMGEKPVEQPVADKPKKPKVAEPNVIQYQPGKLEETLNKAESPKPEAPKPAKKPRAKKPVAEKPVPTPEAPAPKPNTPKPRSAKASQAAEILKLIETPPAEAPAGGPASRKNVIGDFVKRGPSSGVRRMGSASGYDWWQSPPMAPESPAPVPPEAPPPATVSGARPALGDRTELYTPRTYAPREYTPSFDDGFGQRGVSSGPAGPGNAMPPRGVFKAGGSPLAAYGTGPLGSLDTMGEDWFHLRQPHISPQAAQAAVEQMGPQAARPAANVDQDALLKAAADFDAVPSNVRSAVARARYSPTSDPATAGTAQAIQQEMLNSGKSVDGPGFTVKQAPVPSVDPAVQAQLHQHYANRPTPMKPLPFPLGKRMTPAVPRGPGVSAATLTPFSATGDLDSLTKWAGMQNETVAPWLFGPADDFSYENPAVRDTFNRTAPQLGNREETLRAAGLSPGSFGKMISDVTPSAWADIPLPQAKEELAAIMQGDTVHSLPPGVSQPAQAAPAPAPQPAVPAPAAAAEIAEIQATPAPPPTPAPSGGIQIPQFTLTTPRDAAIQRRNAARPPLGFGPFDRLPGHAEGLLPDETRQFGFDRFAASPQDLRDASANADAFLTQRANAKADERFRHTGSGAMAGDPTGLGSRMRALGPMPEQAERHPPVTRESAEAMLAKIQASKPPIEQRFSDAMLKRDPFTEAELPIDRSDRQPGFTGPPQPVDLPWDTAEDVRTAIRSSPITQAHEDELARRRQIVSQQGVARGVGVNPLMLDMLQSGGDDPNIMAAMIIGGPQLVEAIQRQQQYNLAGQREDRLYETENRRLTNQEAYQQGVLGMQGRELGQRKELAELADRRAAATELARMKQDEQQFGLQHEQLKRQTDDAAAERLVAEHSILTPHQLAMKEWNADQIIPEVWGKTLEDIYERDLFDLDGSLFNNSYGGKTGVALDNFMEVAENRFQIPRAAAAQWWKAMGKAE